MGLRSKLIWLFVTIKVLPLILLAWLAWTQSEKLANVLSQHYREFETVSRDSLQKIGGQAIDDSMASIEDRARSEIERLTTDTAKQIAHFLYARDDDVRLISAQQPSLQNYQSFLQHRNVMAPMQHVWEFSDSQNQWLQVGVPSKTTELVAPLGENKSNEHVLPENSRAYHSRPPETTNQFVKKPLYHEITFVSLTGQELIKVSNSDLLSKQLRDISDTQNTFIKAESYFSHLARLQPGEVYVSDVIGAYVPAHFIGNYTRDRAMKEGVEFAPEKSAYAGKENPKGERFRGIVRWATPVVQEGKMVGYVTLALDHQHLMNITDGVMPTNQRYTTYPDPSKGNYAFIWDHLGRNIAHPRHYFITGYDPATGQAQVPWLEQSAYDQWQASGLAFHDYAQQANTFQNQSLNNKPAKQLGPTGLRGLDCRFLDFAPQCTGWYNLTKQGGSGSFIIYWSGLWKLVTAAPIPYFTGQYGNTSRGFGIVTVGTNIDEFYQPAKESEANLNALIEHNSTLISGQAGSGKQAIIDNLLKTAQALGYSTIFMIVMVILVAIWVASYFSNRIIHLVKGMELFQNDNRQFRFRPTRGDEISTLAIAFDHMADTVDNNLNRLESEIDRRRLSEGQLLDLKNELEVKVQKRTQELTQEIEYRMEVQERVSYLADHDELTGLPNRRGFNAGLENALVRAKKHNEKVALLLIDLDHFKEVNDSSGHDVGDKLLCFVANLLCESVREDDIVARLGGDEFAIVMNDIEPMGVVPSIIKRILSRLHAPVLIGSHQIRTGASIGVTLYPDSALDKETMLQQADLALYQVKEQGGLQYHLFDKTLKQAAAKQGALEKQIISALNNEDLMLFFQPCYNYQTHKVESMEALLRLRHSEHGVLDPARFLEIAERSGLACQIDMWLLKNVCTQANQWLQEGIDFGRLSFNVCARELCKNGFAQRVCETLDLLEVPGNCIAIEVMERYAIKDFVNYADNISQLRAKGISIMLDDLGTEHSSLQRMLESDVDVVKIDQYFVQHIGEKRAETVIKSLIGLATGMGVRVIAEGVETQEQLGFLLHNGCFSIQGYIHARPMPAIDISAYFKQLPEA